MNSGTPRLGCPSMFGFDFAAKKKKKNLTSPNRQSPRLRTGSTCNWP